MKLVVQLPALNEEATIAEVIASIPKTIPGIDAVRVVVVNDGSSDRTASLAEAAGAVVVSHEKPRGVGAAFRSGLMKSSELGADIIVTMDADGQFNADDIPALIRPILNGEADFVTGSRFVDPAFIPEMPAVKKWGNDQIARWVSSMVKIRFYDVSCGFRAYSRNAFLRLVLLGDFTYTHEVFLSLAFAHVPIKEVPVRVRGVREHGKSRVANNLFRYGWRTASIILKTYRDYRPLRFFSKIAAVLTLLGLCFVAFLGYVKWTTGIFTPHKWSGFVGGAFIGTAIFMFIVGVVAEMLDRIRVAVDESLFRVKRLECTLRDNGENQPPAP
ncbi:MAG TPA: glycosyltransferase family 2 protein [Kiritimatiellia bacterium]|nr:glycosyltransferase family 2 protein [Kiritimatiellia bacterium]HMO99345.1 glycosyltransferase family 2 protein [Kiritimatiellia bacterium]HMP97439.1 glycosyltransferase family 2 protein [Kiritimatiellia bacterium]